MSAGIDLATIAIQTVCGAAVAFVVGIVDQVYFHKPNPVVKFSNVYGTTLIPCLEDHSAIAEALIQVVFALTAPDNLGRKEYDLEIEREQPRMLTEESPAKQCFVFMCVKISQILGRYRYFLMDKKSLSPEYLIEMEECKKTIDICLHYLLHDVCMVSTKEQLKIEAMEEASQFILQGVCKLVANMSAAA